MAFLSQKNAALLLRCPSAAELMSLWMPGKTETPNNFKEIAVWRTGHDFPGITSKWAA